LRCHSNLFQVFPDFHVQGVFIHNGLQNVDSAITRIAAL
jgi:hypothetical protein